MLRRFSVVFLSLAVALAWLWWMGVEALPRLTPTPPPPTPSADIAWSAGMETTADIAQAFNHARETESVRLAIDLPPIALPGQEEWDALTSQQQALYLINQERTARGLQPFAGLSPAVTRVAQDYAATFLEKDEPLSHELNGQDPGARLAAEPEIAHCIRGWAENLAAFWTSADTVRMPIARAVYGWMYEDGECCQWGHRHALLSDMFRNGPPTGGKGVLGIGLAVGGPYQGLQSGAIVVMEAVEPCRRWEYDDIIYDIPAVPANGAAPVATRTPTPSSLSPAVIWERLRDLLGN